MKDNLKIISMMCCCTASLMLLAGCGDRSEAGDTNSTKGSLGSEISSITDSSFISSVESETESNISSFISSIS